jgi:hypothetical protein
MSWPGDGCRRGNGRQFAGAIPVRLGDLVEVRAKLAARVLGKEAEHELIGKRPGLRRKVADFAYLDVHFLANFAAQRVLGTLSRLDEAGQRVEYMGRGKRALLASSISSPRVMSTMTQGAIRG